MASRINVTVAPSAKGFGKAVEGEIDSGVAGASKSAGGRLKSLATSVVKWGTAAVVGVGAAITGLALKGGISRALNIEDAQAKLKGLGHDAQSVEAIMTNALASVKGTAFGLDTAATVAATAVAAGIKPGQELEKYLRLTADAATIAGVSMEEMGSILNKATTAGRVYTRELNQLADRGLPIFQWLQEEYGVTAEELRKMVERGEVDAETFRKVIEDNIGGAALAAGDTTRGAFANMRAAMSRFGEALIGPNGLGFVKTFFNEVTTIFDGLTDRAKPFIAGLQEQFGDALNPEGMGDRFLAKFDEIVALVKSGPIPELLSALHPLLPAVTELASALGGALGDAARTLGEALAPVLPLIAEELTDAVVDLTPSFIDLVDALVPVIPPLTDLAIEVLPPLVDLLGELVPILADVLEGLSGLLIGSKLRDEFVTGKAGIEELAQGFQNITGPMQRFIELGSAVGSSTSDFVRDVMLSAYNLYSGVSGVFNALNSFIASIWGGIVSTIGGDVDRAVGIVQSLPDRIMAIMTGSVTWLVDSGKALIQGFIDGINSMTDSVGSAVGEIMDFVGGFFPHSPAKRGPFSGAGWDQIGSAGRAIIDEFNLGLSEQMPALQVSLDHMVEIPTAGTGGSPSVVQNNTFNAMDADYRLLLRQAGRELIGAGVFG